MIWALRILYIRTAAATFAHEVPRQLSRLESLYDAVSLCLEQCHLRRSASTRLRSSFRLVAGKQASAGAAASTPGLGPIGNVIPATWQLCIKIWKIPHFY